MQRALLSVTDKTGIVEFGRALHALGYGLLSTGGTCEALRAAGVQVQQVADYTGFPEMMAGRIKTLHPRVHGGILAPRDDHAAQAAMAAHGIDPIDVVAVNLYRFRAAAARAGASEHEAIENIDIGGPAMIRSAAKNHAHVLVVVDPADYPEVLALLRAGDAAGLAGLRRRLAAKAFAHTAAYDCAIAQWFAGTEFGASLAFVGEKVRDLRYGENPHQRAAFYGLSGASGAWLATANVLGGKELSYNNILDLDAALGLAMEFAASACVIVKHTNPCGSAIATTQAAAFTDALASDPSSAFGGILAVNQPLTEATARTIVAAELFLECLVAPDVAPAAAAILEGGKGGKSLRVLTLGGAALPPQSPQVRFVHGGFLAQTPDAPTDRPPALQTVTQRSPSDAEVEALTFAWRVAKHVKSNAIVLAQRRAPAALATVGVGAGQMSRVDAVRLAAEKAGARARGAVLASDAFFPFADGIEAAARAGVTAVIQPGGSKRDPEAIAAADAAGMAMVFTGVRHFRH